jgi:hypothetical protein
MLLFLQRNKLVFSIIVFFLALIITVALIYSFWPKDTEQFIELGLLGSDKTADGYYPNDNPTLSTGSQLNWYIYLHNHTTNSQSIIIKVILLNSTMQAPNDTENIPSPFASVVELPFFLPVDNTQLIPFSWSILETVTQNSSIVITSLMVNGQTFNVYVPALSNSSFNMVFELWVYNQASHEYVFGLESEKEFVSASVNIAFDVS